MACQFSIPFKGNASTIISRVNEAITKAGGSFTTAGNTGSFHISPPIGKISGEFAIEASLMKINISHKPVFIPCKTIEQYIARYLAE
ncbi:MAG: hypothetical protein H0W62_08220 [Chitinophagales bacterium]|nr:hypothetical protein [Chitinophagales bacterium]